MEYGNEQLTLGAKPAHSVLAIRVHSDRFAVLTSHRSARVFVLSGGITQWSNKHG
jgi:hypothetical protein